MIVRGVLKVINPHFMTKKISLVLLLVFTVLFFDACRIKGTDSGTDTLAGVVLDYYKFGDEKDVMEPIIADYLQDKKGLTINYRYFNDFDQYQRVILNEMAEGEGPDIFSMPNSWFFSNYKKLSPLPPEYGTVSDFDTLFVDSASKDLIVTDIDGFDKVYGVPMTIDTLALYYNKRHFEEKIPSQGRPSATWDGIKDDVSLLNVYNLETGVLETGGLALGLSSNIYFAVDVFYALLVQSGISFYDERMSTTKFSSSQTGTKNSLSDLLKLFASFSDSTMKNYSWNSLLSDSESEYKDIEAFVNGRVSMIFGYSDVYEKILSLISESSRFSSTVISKEDVKVAPFPQFDTSSSGKITYASYFAETVSRNCERPDLAWDFLIYLTQKKTLTSYFDKTKKPTSRRDMIEEQSKHPIYGVFVTQIGFSKSFPIVDLSYYGKVFSNMLEFIGQGGDITRAYKEAENSINGLLPSKGFINDKID
jgi:ABC-type glycerol-3-phosphate transport system substrate-binding protein